MAQRRLINKALGSSSKVLRMYKQASQFADFANFLFTLIVAHSDDWGRFRADLDTLLMTVLPAAYISNVHPQGDYEKALQLLHEENLIRLYEVQGRRYGLVLNFDREQPGLHKRSKPEYPGPDGNLEELAPETPDERRKPLKEYADSRWQEVRGCKLTSATTQKDWVQFNKMLKRTREDQAMILEALKASFDNFLVSPDHFDQKQGFAYWCTNVTKFLNPANAMLPVRMPRRIDKRPFKCMDCHDTGRLIRIRDSAGHTKSIAPWSEDAGYAAEVFSCSCGVGRNAEKQLKARPEAVN
jgi:hypothetical protein